MKKIKNILLFLIFWTFILISGRLWAVDTLAGLQLTGQLQIFREDNLAAPIKEILLAVQLAFKEPQRSNSPRFVSFGSIPLEDLGAGTYLFRVNIFHQSTLKIASIETTTAVRGGSDVDFSQAQWRYDFDDDGDGFANLTELVDGHLEAPSGGTIPTIWVGDSTDPNNSTSLPAAISLIKPAAISTMAPSSSGRLKVLGDPLAVQSGVYVTAILRNAAGGQKGKVSGFSRLDGSFDLNLTNAAVGDKVEVFTASLPTLMDDPRFTSVGSSTGPSSRKEMTVQGLSVCQ